MNIKYFLIAALSLGICSGTALPEGPETPIAQDSIKPMSEEVNAKLLELLGGVKASNEIDKLVQLQVLKQLKDMEKKPESKIFKDACKKVFKDNLTWIGSQVVFWGSVYLALPVVAKSLGYGLGKVGNDAILSIFEAIGAFAIGLVGFKKA